MDYICVCGREFPELTKLNGHKRSCRLGRLSGLERVEHPIEEHPIEEHPIEEYDINSEECRYLREQIKSIDSSAPINIHPRPVKMFGYKKFGIPLAIHYVLLTSFMEKHHLSHEVGNDLLLLVRQMTCVMEEAGEVPLPKEYRELRKHVLSNSKDRLRTPETVNVSLPSELFGDLSKIAKKDRVSKGPALDILTAAGIYIQNTNFHILKTLF